MPQVYHITQLPLLVCLHCNQIFAPEKGHYPRNQKRKFCSRECADFHLHKHMDVIEANAETIIRLYTEEGKSSLEIGEQFGVPYVTICQHLVRCDIPRREKGLYFKSDRNPGKHRTEETRQKIRNAKIKHFSNPENRALTAHKQRQAMAEGRFKSSSKLEDTVAIGLSQLGFAFIRQYAVRNPENGQYGACVDFMLSDGRAIEVNGTFWHADPRVYPDGPLHASQKHTVENYQRKIALLNLLSIPVVELWEKDLKHDLIATIMQTLG